MIGMSGWSNVGVPSPTYISCSCPTLIGSLFTSRSLLLISTTPKRGCRTNHWPNSTYLRSRRQSGSSLLWKKRSRGLRRKESHLLSWINLYLGSRRREVFQAHRQARLLVLLLLLVSKNARISGNRPPPRLEIPIREIRLRSQGALFPRLRKEGLSRRRWVCFISPNPIASTPIPSPLV